MRPRTILYVVVMAIVGALMLYQLTTRQHMGLSVLHVRAPMYTTTSDGGVRNGYTLRFSNKWSEPHEFAIVDQRRRGRRRSKAKRPTRCRDGRLTVSVDPDATQEVELYVTAPRRLGGRSRALRSS